MIDTKNAVYHLGHIDWFGGYSSKIDDYNNFGFLAGGIYFKKAVFDSPNADKYVFNRLSGDSVLFILLSENDVSKGAGWVRLLSEISGEDLIRLYSENKSVKEIFTDLSNTLELLNIQAVQSLLKVILQAEGTHRLVEFIQNWPNYSPSISTYLMDLLPLQDMSDNDLIKLFLCCSEYEIKITELLEKTYPSWIYNNEVIEKLRTWHFPQCVHKGIETQDIASLSRLFERVSDQEIKEKLTAVLPFDQFASNLSFCLAMNDKLKASILETQLENDNQICLDSLDVLLTTIDPFSSPKSTVILGNKLYALNLPLDAWKHLDVAERVWFILFLSFQLINKNVWIDSFRKIYVFEHKRNMPDNAVLAAISFLSIALVSDTKKQETFDEAHRYLEDAITDDFEKTGAPSKSLMQLICRCKKNGSFAICSARYWSSHKTAWCNSYRGSCSLFSRSNSERIDYRKTRYVDLRENGDSCAICSISLVDLFNNIGFRPSLANVYSPAFGYKWDIDEYPYRISGRVLQLSRLFSHMHCRCKKMMRSNYAYSVKPNARVSITHAFCPDASGKDVGGHDADVYLNECWNCGEVIDSRECHFKQGQDGQFYPADQNAITGYYVCMKCAAGAQNSLPSICPKCGCADSSLLKFREVSGENYKKRTFISCSSCGYISSSWKSAFES